MKRTGIARLPLHYGRAPRYLTVRMCKLAREMVTIIVDEYGSDEFLKRISDPYWFQALGCVLGYDWHSSGVTTVVTGVLKQALAPAEQHIAVCGGKGRVSRQTPAEIGSVGEEFGFPLDKIQALQHASRMSAKVDNTAIQAGYQLYHHAFLITEDKKWAVIQQGMCTQDRTARRYHWLSENVQSFVNEPHNGIVGDARREIVLNMTAKESEGCRKASVDIAKEQPRRLVRLLISAKPEFQKSLDEWFPKTSNNTRNERTIDFLSMPENINWKALEAVYEFQPQL